MTTCTVWQKQTARLRTSRGKQSRMEHSFSASFRVRHQRLWEDLECAIIQENPIAIERIYKKIQQVEGKS